MINKAFRPKPAKTTLLNSNSYKGEPIEAKIRRMFNNNEQLPVDSPLIYQRREEGVEPNYDIRTDRFEVAVDAMDKVHKTEIAKREMRIGERTYDTMSEAQQTEFNTKFPGNKHAKKAAQAAAKAGGGEGKA